MTKVIAKPIVKWAGGKGQLINTISERFPNDFGTTIDKYAEPFVGGGALLFNILSKYSLKDIYISDINKELINTYLSVRDSAEDVISVLEEYSNRFIPANSEERKKLYYSVRDEYNSHLLNQEDKPYTRDEIAAMFIFLNRTCFNGLYRTNRNGAFNVPMGKYTNPTICDAKNIRLVSDVLKPVNIYCADYTACAEFADEHTLIYFDPPYRPLKGHGNFTAYTEEDFNDSSQIDLANFSRVLSDRGVYIISSNADPHNIDPDDDFFEEIYEGFSIDRVHAKRLINSQFEGRGEISELIITNY